ncbi:hypothetical protein LOC67_16840 [Stieleria sp. JC731]|uniref:hypothetical protein n=1 Tax=Stieleria sp. JC731 TaxID=2894195 RepID=UPI001E2E44DB|nr:hypothetical protein [Stieleria sp. JC731]MCC9602224.1 hypothetical protein [Stieleria sp. JC731]
MLILRTCVIAATVFIRPCTGDEIPATPRYQTLANLVQAAHTTDLPVVDRIEVLALPVLDDDEDPEPALQSETFLIRPASPKTENGSLVIPSSEISVRSLSSKVFGAKDAKRIAADWRALEFQPNGAFCHVPTYGIRFYRGDDLIFNVSVCWKCHNFYLPAIDPDSGKPSAILYGFDDNAPAKRFLNDLRRLVPHPHIKHPRLR